MLFSHKMPSGLAASLPEALSVNARLKLGPSRVGVFDSGVGGLCDLPALQEQLPQAEPIYLADSG
ncbi:MAG: hypothetical protein FJY26_06730 [Betaproteobacteria bacterium]|nr:hypothetical protein [Betaproteobacteria bacterium]